MKYIREFIELKQEAPGYAIGGTKVNGSCKYEVLHEKVKIKISLRNLRYANNAYTVDVIKTDGDKSVGVNLGELKVNTDGRSQFEYQRDLTNSDDCQILKDFDVIVVMAKKDGKKELITPAVGYRRERLLWRHNFRYFDDEDSLKKFQLHINDVIEKNTSVEENKTDNSPIIIDTEDEIIIELPPDEEEIEVPSDKIEPDEPEEEADEEKEESEKQSVESVESVIKEENNDNCVKEPMAIEGEHTSESIRQVDHDEIKPDIEIKYIDYDENSCKGVNGRKITKEHQKENLDQLKDILELKDINYESSSNKNKKDTMPLRFSRKAEEMFTTYPKLSPFEDGGDNEGWIRIEPRDIAIFPIKTWRLMNNPFLMNGYYKHHHILLGEKTNDKDSRYYLIAVPAQYNPRQNRIAKIHGFEYFRSCRKVNPRTGEFGYWIKEIHL